LVVPQHVFFSALLVLFEAVGVLVLSGGRTRQTGLVAAIGFHVALVSFGWWYYLWSVPMVAAPSRLLRAERRRVPTPGPAAPDGRQGVSVDRIPSA
jgi:hypothetical protein